MPTIARVLIAVVLVVFAGAFLSFKFFVNTASVSTELLFASSFPDAQNRQQSFAQWRGKVIVVNFWASWCPPCREEMPALDAMQTKYASKDVQFVGISAEDVSKLQQFSNEMKIGYPLLAGDIDVMSLAQGMGNDKSILPYTVVIDKKGKIVKIWYGIIDITELETVLKPLI